MSIGEISIRSVVNRVTIHIHVRIKRDVPIKMAISISNVKEVLEELNCENYEMLKLGLNNRMIDNERFLLRIERRLLGTSEIQEKMYKKYLKKLKSFLEGYELRWLKNDFKRRIKKEII